MLDLSRVRTDRVLAGAITALAGVLRFAGVGSPTALVFDEIYYVPDACRYVIESPDLCGVAERTFFHPPLGKWLIAFGMEILGPTRYGWRLMPVLAGTATVLVLYFLARRVTGSTVAAVVAAGALALDPLHFVQSRTALLDVFVALFATCAFACAVRDRDDERTGYWRPWRAATGIALGAAVATKWPSLYFVPVTIALIAWWDHSRTQPADAPERSRATRVVTLAAYLVVLPAVVYALSYAGRIDQPLLAVPWQVGSWFRFFVDRQGDMWQYHSALRQAGLLPPHELASPAWSWLLLKRPMTFHFEVTAAGLYREILATGNPLVWFPAIPASAFVAFRAVKSRGRDAAALVATLAFAASYVPWLVFTLGTDPYLFYFVSSVPFLCLIVGYCFASLWRRDGRTRLLLVAWAVATAAVFAFYYPVLTARPLSRDAWMARMLYRQCEPRAAEDAGRPPLPNRTAHGTWCWI